VDINATSNRLRIGFEFVELHGNDGISERSFNEERNESI
jgi:hypothetical protein